MEKIRIGIVGYGNIGKGLETAIQNNPRYGIGCSIYKKRPFHFKD